MTKSEQLGKLIPILKIACLSGLVIVVKCIKSDWVERHNHRKVATMVNMLCIFWQSRENRYAAWNTYWMMIMSQEQQKIMTQKLRTMAFDMKRLRVYTVTAIMNTVIKGCTESYWLRGSRFDPAWCKGVRECFLEEMTHELLEIWMNNVVSEQVGDRKRVFQAEFSQWAQRGMKYHRA